MFQEFHQYPKIIEFNYSGSTDKKPKVFIIREDFDENKSETIIRGINLNYLSSSEIENLKENAEKILNLSPDERYYHLTIYHTLAADAYRTYIESRITNLIMIE